MHTASRHGADDYVTLSPRQGGLRRLRSPPKLPLTVAEVASYFPHVPFFSGLQIYDHKGQGRQGNIGLIDMLAEGGRADRARVGLKPSIRIHGARKAPLLFRNTPQWFHRHGQAVAILDGKTLARRWRSRRSQRPNGVPESGENRITGMVENRPDWVVSRPARLGCADHRLRPQGRPARCCSMTGSTRPSPRASEAEGADAVVSERSGPSISRRSAMIRRSTRGSMTFSMSGSIPASTHSFNMGNPPRSRGE